MGHPNAGSFVSARHLRELRCLWCCVGIAAATVVQLIAFWLA